MDKGSTDPQESQYDKAGFFSRLLFIWTWQFYRQPPEYYDDLKKIDSMSKVFKNNQDILHVKLAEDWDTEKLQRKPSFAKSLYRTFGS